MLRLKTVKFTLPLKDEKGNNHTQGKFGVAVKKGNNVLLEKINAALDELAKDGSLKEISEKIFGADLIAVK